MPKLTYYMYLCGVYHSPAPDSSIYGTSIMLYLVTLAVLLIERVCLTWENGRFGCENQVFDIIMSFQQKIMEVERRIARLKRPQSETKA